MLMKMLLPFVAVVLAFTSVRGQEPTPGAVKAAEKLAEVMDIKAQMSNGLEAMMPMITNMSEKMKLNPTDAKELEGIFRTWFTEDLDHTKIFDETIKLYAQNFTEEELAGLAAFYESPLGRKSLTALPQLMKKGAQIGMAEGQAKQEKLRARLEPFFKKHAPSGNP